MPQTFDTPLFSSDQSIDRVLKAGLPVMLVFLSGTAPQAQDQAMKAVAKQEAGKLLVVQMHVKDSPETARKYAILSTPAVVTIKNGQVQSQAENISSDELQRHANFLLGRGPKPEPKAQPQYSTANAYAGGAPAGAYPSQPQQPYSAATDGQAEAPVAVSDATFAQQVLQSPVPVVVDFWAPWCGPCKMVAPVLDKLAREWGGRAKIVKINVDENPMIAGQYGVSSIPTMMVVKDGKIVDRWAGALPEPVMRSRLATNVH